MVNAFQLHCLSAYDFGAEAGVANIIVLDGIHRARLAAHDAKHGRSAATSSRATAKGFTYADLCRSHAHALIIIEAVMPPFRGREAYETWPK